MTEHAALAPWWHPQSLALDECWHYTIGPIALYFKRGQQEWQFSVAPSESAVLATPQANQSVVAALETQRVLTTSHVVSKPIACLPELLTSQRYVFRHSPTAFRLTPKLLERPVVVKTRQPVSIPAGEQCVFYISSPVCIQVSLEQPVTPLFEMPIQRLSDTWFGSSTQHGQLCYADKTQARQSLTDIPARPHRAVTAVTIENRSDKMLTIDKISIPLPFLALYGRDDGTLWTDPITLLHEAHGSLTRFKIDKTLPPGVSTVDMLTPPREMPDKHSLVRAFTGIFSQ
ncbi:DUF432 domain-containing protein [Alishewanella tabrizica]|uniref:DUF432 domain-containing protein n=1 Tax=Alishewanella tabrizica TaxID=671278 RepID=A0ABQ2WS72_9ALTE|nr:DUF432 domain-containing protein [Alishewanella tabrizica]GGW69831.1 hypothetical protein GCM10008111_27400 [Alishewanella tabrizica]